MLDSLLALLTYLGDTAQLVGQAMGMFSTPRMLLLVLGGTLLGIVLEERGEGVGFAERRV